MEMFNKIIGLIKFKISRWLKNLVSFIKQMQAVDKLYMPILV